MKKHCYFYLSAKSNYISINITVSKEAYQEAIKSPLNKRVDRSVCQVYEYASKKSTKDVMFCYVEQLLKWLKELDRYEESVCTDESKFTVNQVKQEIFNFLKGKTYTFDYNQRHIDAFNKYLKPQIKKLWFSENFTSSNSSKRVLTIAKF